MDPDYDLIHLNSVPEVTKSLRLPEKKLDAMDSQENIQIGGQVRKKRKVRDESSDYDSGYHSD